MITNDQNINNNNNKSIQNKKKIIHIHTHALKYHKTFGI